MAEFKATVFKAEVKRLEKDTPKMKAGDYLIDVVWKATHKKVYEQWTEIPESEKALWLNKAYFLSPTKVGKDNKPMIQISKERLESELNYTGNGSDISTLAGFESVLITDDSGEYPRVLYVNNPNRKKAATSAFAKVDKDDFLAIFNGGSIPKEESRPEPKVAHASDKEELPF